MEPGNAGPLIPRRVLFGNADKALPTLSPDGTKIAFLAPVEGVMNVWVGPASTPSSARPVTIEEDRGIHDFYWAYTDGHILYGQDNRGDDNFHAYSVDLDTGLVTDLTPVDGIQARIGTRRISLGAGAFSPSNPDEILVSINDRLPQFHDVYLINLATGNRRLIQQAGEAMQFFMLDDQYEIRFALRATPDGGAEEFIRTEDGNWKLFRKVEMEDVLTYFSYGFDKTMKVRFMQDSSGRDTVALVATDLDSGEAKVIAEDPKTDVKDALVHPSEKYVQAVAFGYERTVWQILDDSIAPDMEYLSGVADGELYVVSRCLDDSKWIVGYQTDTGPTLYYLYDKKHRRADFLFEDRDDLRGPGLARMHSAVTSSRDELELVSYYTLPPGSTPDGRDRPDKPLPMVLVVHGGPYARDIWGFNPVHQLLANRGYAVLSVNFRGSVGFGKKFLNASNLEWGGKMQDDLIDGVKWAIAEGIADPERIAILGSSYGGYATLMGLALTPDTFVCGVDLWGISNLVTFAEALPPYFQAIIDVHTQRVGDHRTAEGRKFLLERSPLTYADRIKKPLLIAQGAHDSRITKSESDQIVRAVGMSGVPVTYLLYPDEGHGLARPENNLSLWAVVDAFLANHLGGRYQPIGDEFHGASITVPVGAEHIPGLATALSER